MKNHRIITIKINGEYSKKGLTNIEKSNLSAAERAHGKKNINPFLENGEVLFLPDYKIDRGDSAASGIEFIWN